MKKKKDIRKPEDIRKVIVLFFEKLKVDPQIGHFFTREVHTDWDAFLPLMCRFWENILFYSGGYYGNPMERHKEIDAITHLTPEDFQRWLTLLNESIDQLYSGETAGRMKERAANIATVLQVKMA